VEVLVSKIWESKDTETGESDLQNLINHVAQYGIKVVSFTSRKAFQKGEHKLNIINPVLIQEITQMSNQPDVLQPDQSPTLSEKQYHASPKTGPAKNKLPVFIILFILFILLNGTLFYWVNANSDQNRFFETLGVITKKYEDLRITASRFNQILYADNYSTLKGTSLNASKETIYFRFKSDQLTDEAQQKLREIFEALTTNQNLKYQIHGYTSNEGEDAYNIDLSLRRAQKVSAFLTAKGIDPSRLIVSGKGSEDNIADNNTEEGRSENRRVELVVEKQMKVAK
jgi:outer membrane protein OmpA-like peptidoglycan-associated protein